jgi:hypothetical protein
VAGAKFAASRIAPAMLMPVEPPTAKPLLLHQVKDDRQRLLVGNLEGEIGRETLRDWP